MISATRAGPRLPDYYDSFGHLDHPRSNNNRFAKPKQCFNGVREEMEKANFAVALLGSGYWGKNLGRVFNELHHLKWVCDTSETALAEAHNKLGVRTTQDLNAVLADQEVQGVVIAAPAAQHFELTRRCLTASKDVYVEKPLALHAEQGQELVELATKHDRILMVGHILEYHPAVLELKRLIREGALGNIQYIYSSRLNLGKLRTEENILWSFAPHDISAILFLLNEEPIRISTHGGNYLNHNVDTTLTTCEFPSGVQAHIFVSWLHPFKEQKLTIVGGRKMAVFDDLEPEHKLVLYSHHIDWVDRIPIAQKQDGEIVPLLRDEPLRVECEHFLECIRSRQKPRTSGENALRVLKVLEGCEQSLKLNGHPCGGRSLTAEILRTSDCGDRRRRENRRGDKDLALLTRDVGINDGVSLQSRTERCDQPRSNHRQQCEDPEQCFCLCRGGVGRRRVLRSVNGLHKCDQPAEPRYPEARISAHIGRAGCITGSQFNRGMRRHYRQVRIYWGGRSRDARTSPTMR